MTHAIHTYLDIANLVDQADRTERLSTVAAAGVTYVDPHAPDVITGRDQLADFLTLFRSRVPHVRFELDGAVEAFHHAYRVRWRLVDGGDGSAFSAGTFAGTTDAEGRLDLILGFIDQEPGSAR